MTYSLDYRKQALKSLDEDMTFTEAATFYDIGPQLFRSGKSVLVSVKKTTCSI